MMSHPTECSGQLELKVIRNCPAGIGSEFYYNRNICRAVCYAGALLVHALSAFLTALLKFESWAMKCVIYMEKWR